MKLLILPSFHAITCASITFLIAVSSCDCAKIEKKETIINDVSRTFFILVFNSYKIERFLNVRRHYLYLPACNNENLKNVHKVLGKQRELKIEIHTYKKIALILKK